MLWKHHVARVKAQCDKINSILKAITCQEWGADQGCVTKIYRMYIRAKIEYGSPVYSSAAKTTLDELNPIVTEAQRTATGAFRSTTRETIHVLTNEPPLNFRRDYTSLRHFYKIKSQIKTPQLQASFHLPTEPYLETKEYHNH